jgi:hypothetical protein
VALQGESRVLRHFWKNNPAEVEAPANSLSGLVSIAHQEMKSAESACRTAKNDLFAYESQSKTYGLKLLPNGSPAFQLDQDPERLRLSLIAARCSDAFQAKTKRWSELDRQLHPEVRYVAGVPVTIR